jgi:hypothetical protein
MTYMCVVLYIYFFFSGLVRLLADSRPQNPDGRDWPDHPSNSVPADQRRGLKGVCQTKIRRQSLRPPIAAVRRKKEEAKENCDTKEEEREDKEEEEEEEEDVLLIRRRSRRIIKTMPGF